MGGDGISEFNQWSILMFPIWACWMVALQVPNGIWETLLHPPIDVIIRLHKWLLCVHRQPKRQMLLVSQSIFPSSHPSPSKFHPASAIILWRWKATQISERWQRWVLRVGYTRLLPSWVWRVRTLECTWTDPQVDIPQGAKWIKEG